VAKKRTPTASERRLLEHPPTQHTWICRGCETYNRGALQQCWACAKPRPEKPKRLWPLYLKVCEKHGHTPGEPWRPLAGGDESRNATEGGRTSTPASGTKTRSRRRKRE
jgi:hypothetical protein